MNITSLNYLTMEQVDQFLLILGPIWAQFSDLWALIFIFFSTLFFIP